MESTEVLLTLPQSTIYVRFLQFNNTQLLKGDSFRELFCLGFPGLLSFGFLEQTISTHAAVPQYPWGIGSRAPQIKSTDALGLYRKWIVFGYNVYLHISHSRVCLHIPAFECIQHNAFVPAKLKFCFLELSRNFSLQNIFYLRLVEPLNVKPTGMEGQLYSVRAPVFL